MMGAVELKSIAKSSAKWALLSNIAPKVVTPALLAILTRLLTPQDYGVISIATLLLALLIMVPESSLLPAIIQSRDKAEEAANQSFWLGLGFGLILYVFVWFAAPSAASLFGEPRLTSVLRVLSLQLVILALVMPPQALLTRDFNFRKLFVARLVASIAPYCVSIPLAASRLGYWALVGGTLAGSIANVVVMWSQSTWRPRLVLNPRLALHLVSFGRFVLLESSLGWMLTYFDNAIVGKVMGVGILGIYALGFDLATLAISIPISAITAIALPTFSRMQSNIAELGQTYLEGTRFICYYGIPAGIGLALLAGPAANVVYGQKWPGLGVVLSILAIYRGFGYLWILNTEAFRAIGRPDINAKLYLLFVPLMTLIFILSARYGIVVFCWARASVVLLAAPFHTGLAVKYLRLPQWYLLELLKAPLIATCGMAAVIMGLGTAMGRFSDLQRLLCLLPAGVLVYGGLLLLIDHRARSYARSLVRGWHTRWA